MYYKEFYSKENIAKVAKEFDTTNVFAVPKIQKIVINVGVGEAVSSKNVIDEVVKQITSISGQKPVVTRARKSVSAFKIREGLAIGVKVTLRGVKMVAFFDKLVNVVIPMLKDFRGISKTAVDTNGNLNLGFSEQTIFPEIDFDAIDKIRGLQVTVATNARDNKKGYKLFELLGVPFVK